VRHLLCRCAPRGPPPLLCHAFGTTPFHSRPRSAHRASLTTFGNALRGSVLLLTRGLGVALPLALLLLPGTASALRLRPAAARVRWCIASAALPTAAVEEEAPAAPGGGDGGRDRPKGVPGTVPGTERTAGAREASVLGLPGTWP
jgi:hypothetical protein